MKRVVLEELLSARNDRRACVLISALDREEQFLISNSSTFPDIPAPIRDAADDAMRRDRASIETYDNQRYFLQPFNPAPRLIIIGAVHIAQHLARLSQGLDQSVTVIDPRSAFATIERFPDVDLRVEWPKPALENLKLDARCAVVTLSHDPKIDDPALTAALRSDAYYIGCLGSRRTQTRRHERLRDIGFDESELARLHGPVGLDLGAASPAEIALSIAAEIMLSLRGKKHP